MSTVQTEAIETTVQNVPFVADGQRAYSRAEKWQGYYELTKPGITKMVVLSASAGYYLAAPAGMAAYFSQFHNVLHFFGTVIGATLVSGGSCVLNHYIERDIDQQMKRTMNRPIPSGKIAPQEALVFGILLSVLGLGILWPINFLTFVLAVMTLVSYIAVYTPMKRKSTLSTLVGAIPGALPAMGGWVAVSNHIDTGSLAMFLILFFWQIPHFLSLSWLYKKDYERGGFPMLSVVDDEGKMLTRQVLLYTVVLLPVSLILTKIGATGMVYFYGALAVNLMFIIYAVKFKREVSAVNARKMLLCSYFYLLSLIVLMFADKA